MTLWGVIFYWQNRKKSKFGQTYSSYFAENKTFESLALKLPLFSNKSFLTCSGFFPFNVFIALVQTLTFN